MRSARIIVLGATGVMGQRLMRLLSSEVAPQHLLGVSRHTRPLAIDVHAPPPDDLLKPGDVLIDAVGPYRHDPAPWVRACARAGAHWIDLCESDAFAARVRAAKASDAASTSALSGCSTLPALTAALLANMRHGLPDNLAHSAEVALSMGSRNAPSAGLIYSLLRPLGRPLPRQPGRAWRARATRALSDGTRRTYGSYPCPALGLDAPVSLWSGFDRALLWWPLYAASWLLPWVPDRALAWISRPAAWLATGWRPLGGHEGSLRLAWRDAQGAEVVVGELLAPRAGLDIPALPAVWAATRLRGTAQAARSLDALISAPEAIALLTARGYTWHITRPRRDP